MIMIKELAQAASWVSQAVPDKPVTPILAGVMLHQGAIWATDYDRTHYATVTGLDETLHAVVPGRALAAVLAALRGDEVELVVEPTRLSLTAGRSTVRLPLLAVEDFPTLPHAAEPSITLTGLGDAVDRLVGFTATGGVDWQSGIRVESVGDELVLVGGSPYLIARWRLPAEGTLSSSVVPAASLAAVLAGMGSPVGLAVGTGSLSVSSPGRVAVLRTMAVNFPQVERLFSGTGPAELRVPGLAAALRLAGALSDVMTLSWADDDLEIRAGGEDGEVVDVMPCQGGTGRLRLSIKRARLLLQDDPELLTVDGRRVVVGSADHEYALQGIREDA